jgi:O-antigen biosynthesis protein
MTLQTPDTGAADARAQPRSRPTARGKSLYADGRRMPVKGVTYGGFRAREHGAEFPSREEVAADFAVMAGSGINAVRTYTVPPTWLLDLAYESGLWVLVGLPWEQHVTFLDDRRRVCSIEERVREGVRSCAGHPAVMSYAVGNEVPASIVRWHGRRRVERFLERLVRAVRQEDPGALVTYVNYPSTEYLDVPGADVVCFNVFLESQATFAAYVTRLQNLAGNRPLLLTELGLDSHRNGEEAQAGAVEGQLRLTYATGCAGAFVFAWTDEWHRGGSDVLDWDFGLVDRERRPKPALAAATRAFEEATAPDTDDWPPMSVVVCSYNGERWIRGCLDALLRIDYPNHEVIVVDDGSTDATGEIAAEYADFTLVKTENVGLSSARNLGMRAAVGEIVAYVDDDARPEPDWLRQLARRFMETRHAAIGGPNIPPPDDGAIADCVANSPGGPIHVMLSDEEAEHVPGCNMAIRKATLEDVGGFDPTFRIAGDDVDLCWRLHRRGLTVGFSPGAVVWHHRRPSVVQYLRQQFQYGKAEALLEAKWPERYNRMGHVSWAGRVYGNSLAQAQARRRGRIRYGIWGEGLFQSVYQPAGGLMASLPLMPEWYLVMAVLAALGALGASWAPLLLALPLFVVAAGATVFEAVHAALHARFTHEPRSRAAGARLRAVTAGLHVLQPLVRLIGRARHGLTPWRRRCAEAHALPRARTTSIWGECWRAYDERLRALEAALRAQCPAVRRGGDFDRWDLEVRGGLLGVARLRMAIEEHGSGKQLVRHRSWPVPSRAALALAAVLGLLAAGAASDGAGLAAAVLAAVAAGLAATSALACSRATGTVLRALAARAAEAPGDFAMAGTGRPGGARQADRPRRHAPASRTLSQESRP